MSSYTLEPIGFIRSTVKGREDAPRQGPEGAPDAWLEIEPQFTEALLGVEVGHEPDRDYVVARGCTFQLLSALIFWPALISPFVLRVTILLPKQPFEYCSH